MAKYIVDMDSFKECLDLLSEGKINGHDYAYIQNIKVFVERFPKDEYLGNAVAYRKFSDEEYSDDDNKNILEGRGLKSLY